MNTITKQSVIKLDAPPGPIIVITPEKHEERDDILALSSIVQSIATPAQMIAATEVLTRLDSMARSVEKTGEDLRRPFTAFAKKIKSVADTFLTDVNKERTRVGSLIADRANEERRAAAELEAQRQRDAAEIQRKAQEEADRIEREQMKAKSDAEYARLEEAKRVIALKAETDRRNFETAAPIEAPTVPGMVARKPVWRFEVIDVNQLPDEFVSRVPNELALQIAIKNGVREIKGCRIFEETPAAFSRRAQ